MEGVELEGLYNRLIKPLQTDALSAAHEPWRAQGGAAIRSLAIKGLFELKDSTGDTLADSLLTIAEKPIWMPLAGEGGNARLLAELAMNLDTPGRINQGWKATCTTTSVESYLAKQDPAEYARIIRGLVSPEGRAVMRSGDELICDEDVLLPSATEHNRNPISRVFQAAAMEFADGELDYDNTSDGHYDDEDENVGNGLEMGPFETLVSALTGKPWRSTSRKHALIAQMLKKMGLDASGIADLETDSESIIEQSTAQGEPVFATLDLPGAQNPIPGAPGTLEHAAHKVLLLYIDKEAGEVHYEDPMDPDKPWFDVKTVRIHDAFGHCSMPLADFGRLLSELTYRSDLWKRPIS